MTTNAIATIENSPLPDRMRYAEVLAESALIPQAFRKHPADVLVAIEYGNALGIAPIVALSEINVIGGTPSLSASLMAALARQAGHVVRTVGDAESATCTIVRKDDPGFEHVAVWDVAKAKASGLWGKGHWSKDPATMLRWRAIAECVRMACSEVLGGIKYTPEEVADFTPAPATMTVTQARAPRTPAPAPSLSLADAIATDRDWYAEADELADVESLRGLYDDAKHHGAPDDALAYIATRGQSLTAAPDADGVVDAEVLP